MYAAAPGEVYRYLVLALTVPLPMLMPLANTAVEVTAEVPRARLNVRFDLGIAASQKIVFLLRRLAAGRHSSPGPA
ncbi:hypothetical protein [Pseudoruegeria sp. HB172150]|uniref:hypothetical protein n=1 Tax=Pseudoruegeria sp. HB172150 TaxID=2721164 RepID=UPI001C12D967|nr:hypothetical protein [Pseudoruegeria sp. HB172150]